MVDSARMEKLLVVCGPTGTGKTNLALTLAKKFNGELVSADSRQVYIGMDIGTGKEMPSVNVKIEKTKGKWTVNEIPIHLYDVVKPNESFSLVDYQRLAVETITNIQEKGKLPILVGGTGLYIRSISEGLHLPKAPPNQKLRDELERTATEELLAELAKVDRETFDRIDKNNRRRLIRALEVYRQTGEPISKLQQSFQPKFSILKIGLTAPRDELYRRNDQRVENWFEIGFIEEVEQLLKNYSSDLTSMTSLGYRQISMYLEKKLSLSEAKQRIKFDFHGYIRRQLTWFKTDRSLYWFDITNESFENEVENVISEWLKAEHKE